MAGFVGVVGDHASTRRARAAARPLLRTPEQTLKALELDGLALAFVAPRAGEAEDAGAGVAAVVDGELILERGAVTGAEAARVLLDLYLADGVRLRPPDGVFAAVLRDERRRLLVLVTDAHGHHPLYLARRAGETLVATELKAIVAAGFEPALDPVAWAEILAYETPLGERTPLAGVRLLPPATTLSLRADGTETAIERDRYVVRPEHVGDPREAAEELGRLLEGAVTRRLDPGTALALSGGLDSRCMASVLMRTAPRTLTATYGTPGSEDLLLGAEIARRGGFSHESLPLESGYLTRWGPATVWLTEGSVRPLHAHQLALRRLRDAHRLDGVLIGFGGDTVLRVDTLAEPAASESVFVDRTHAVRARCLSDGLAEELLTPGFLGQVRGLARDGLARALAEEEGTDVERMEQFMFRQVHRRMIWPATQLFADVLTARDPFVDRELLEFCRRLPWSLRLYGRLQLEYLRATPTLAAVSNPKDGLPPALDGARRTAADTLVKTRRRMARLIDDVLGPRWGAGRGCLSDYAAELRNGSRALPEILLEPRTLERGQIRPEAVRVLVDETLSGRRRHTMALGVLLNLELFQRQLLEGDRPDVEAALPAASAG